MKFLKLNRLNGGVRALGQVGELFLCKANNVSQDGQLMAEWRRSHQSIELGIK